MTKELAIQILIGDVLGTNEQTHEAVKMAVKALVIEPVKHGKWLMNDVYGAYCSECGSAAFEITGSQYSRMKTRYCWQCGARMDEE